MKLSVEITNNVQIIFVKNSMVIDYHVQAVNKTEFS